MKKNIFTRMFTRAICLALVAIMLLPSVVFGVDELVHIDPVANTYTGRAQAPQLINQLLFMDLPDGETVREAIIRGGALEVIRPEAAQFRPTQAVTREEAIAFALRAAGQSSEARALGESMAEAGELPGLPLGRVWAFGYLQLAQQMGLITADEFTAARTLATAPPPVIPDPYDYDGFFPEIEIPIIPIVPLFDSTVPATREEVAFWLVRALEAAEEDIFEVPVTVGISLQSFNDWNTISPSRASAVETLLRHNIMNGQTPTIFAPNSSVPRQEMAQIIRNLDRFHFQLLGIERMTGTVMDTSYEQFIQTGASYAWRHVRVRRADGLVDILQYTLPGTPSPQDRPLDAVVFRGGNVVGLTALQPGDQIEYFVHPETGTVWYVLVTGATPMHTFSGRLQIIDIEGGTMTFLDSDGTIVTFPMIDGMYGIGTDGQPFIRFVNILRPAASLPRGTYYNVTLVGNLITEIAFVGEPVLAAEIRGIVIDNNPLLGSLTILDDQRRERSFSYIPGALTVQRREFFDMRDTVGGIHEMFPGFNPRLTSIDAIIPGDIVVFRVDEEDPLLIVSISSAENIFQRYGRILEFRDQGGFFDMLMEFENGQTSWFSVPTSVHVMDRGRPVSPQQIQIGDWARIIVNQAVLAPGVMMETLREISLDSGGHHITNIVTGRIAGFHHAQNLIQIEHARDLTPAGWSNHRPLASFNIGGPNVRYYHDGRPVTLAHVNRYLQRSNATVYLALENHHAGERAVMVSIRSGRDELIRAGSVLGTTTGGFHLLEIPGVIQTDPGTIVVRNGRLVEQGHIFAPDWARVSLNSHNLAAVVNIEPAPATSGVQIVRGRISQVQPHNSFRVETMSLFDGLRWNFTPIAREFTIDHDTIFINEGGVTSIDDFIGFTEDSVLGQVFNVIVDGSRAVRVIDAPFTEPIPQLRNSTGHLTIRGTIFNIVGETLYLRDVHVFNGRTGQWSIISLVNATGTVNLHPNTIIVDRNQVVSVNGLQVGQQIMAFSNESRDDFDIEPGMSADVYIVLVEN
ncbi:MAG: S-layer homology domain-containing protein [Defluviitaleaceae bacterium]|nr:S-layer homology domain-containing protein [Defluviitaleaceae bacterium]